MYHKWSVNRRLGGVNTKWQPLPGVVKVARGSAHGRLVGLSMRVRWLVRGSESVSLTTHENSEHVPGKLKVYLVTMST